MEFTIDKFGKQFSALVLIAVMGRKKAFHISTIFHRSKELYAYQYYFILLFPYMTYLRILLCDTLLNKRISTY